MGQNTSRENNHSFFANSLRFCCGSLLMSPDRVRLVLVGAVGKIAGPERPWRAALSSCACRSRNAAMELVDIYYSLSFISMPL